MVMKRSFMDSRRYMQLVTLAVVIWMWAGGFWTTTTKRQRGPGRDEDAPLVSEILRQLQHLTSSPQYVTCWPVIHLSTRRGSAFVCVCVASWLIQSLQRLTSKCAGGFPLLCSFLDLLFKKSAYYIRMWNVKDRKSPLGMQCFLWEIQSDNVNRRDIQCILYLLW